MGIKDRSLIEKTNQVFIALTATAIQRGLSVCKNCEFRRPVEFHPGGAAQTVCDTCNVNQMLGNPCIAVFCGLDLGLYLSLAEVLAQNVGFIRSIGYQ
jgi:hypothetical protein